MIGAWASFRAELRDLSRHPLAWLGALAVATAAAVIGAREPIRDNGYVIFEAAMQAAIPTAIYFLVAVAAISVAGDRTRGTVRWILPRPIARRGYVLGKAFAHAVLALVLLVLAVTSSYATAQGAGFGDVVSNVNGDEDDAVFRFVEDEAIEPEFSASTMRRRTMFATFLALPALLTATGIGLLVSTILASSAGAVIAALAVTAPLTYLPEVLGLTAENARNLPLRASTDYLDQVREFGRHLATASWPDYPATAWMWSIGIVVGLPLLAAALFFRRDITD